MISSSPVQEGADVFTTLDHTIQSQAEQVLRETVAHVGREGRDRDRARPDDRRGARDGADARLQREQHVERRALVAKLLRNRAVTDTYEPGSTFKLVTITAALSDGIVTPSTRFTLPYRFQYGSLLPVLGARRRVPRRPDDYSVAQILVATRRTSAR